ncbi:MAG: hypothetical protein ACOY31_09580 [Bacillota bacterium]
MPKKNKLLTKREHRIEKNLARRNETVPDFETGNDFVEEHTGSATMINLDGRWDFDHPV